MPPKRPLSNPPPPSSSEDEKQSETEDEQEPEQMQVQQNGGLEEVGEKYDDEEEGEEDNDDDDDDDEEKSAPKVPASKVNIPADDDCGSETETDSSNSRPSRSASDFAIAPVTSKLMDDSAKPRRDSVKRNLNTSPVGTPTRSVGSKRTNESDVEKKDHKKKKANGLDEEDAKKNTGFQRVWSEEDEIEILKAMIDYRNKKGSEPNADMGAFYEFVKKRINVNASKSQVIDKIRRLKKKYQNYADKSVDGKDPILPRPHEYLNYELSKKIWGPDKIERGEKNKTMAGPGQSSKTKNDNSPVRRKNAEANWVVRVKANGDAHSVRHEDFSVKSSLLSVLALENISSHPEAASSFVRKALPLIDTVKAKEFDESWKELQREQFQLFVKKTSLILDGAKLVLQAIKSSDN